MPVTPIASSDKFVAVTASDTLTLKWQGDEYSTKGIMVGVSGDLAVKDRDGTAVTITGVAAGIIHPITCSVVMSTNTTATGITAFF